jgi:hypothetical protein
MPIAITTHIGNTRIADWGLRIADLLWIQWSIRNRQSIFNQSAISNPQSSINPQSAILNPQSSDRRPFRRKRTAALRRLLRSRGNEERGDEARYDCRLSSTCAF